MAQEQRIIANGLYGQLSAGITAAQTSITDTSFAALPVITSSAQYMPLCFTDSTSKLTEIVWVTAHSSGSNTVTVARGQEVTTARIWPTGTPWAQADTVRDFLIPATSGSQPTNPHYGARWIDTDTNELRGQALNGNQPQFGVARSAWLGPIRPGSFPAAGNAHTIRSHLATVTTNSVGDANVQYRVAFPNDTLCVVAVGADYNTFVGTCNPWEEGPTGFDFRAVGFNSGGAFAITNLTFKIHYIAVGW